MPFILGLAILSIENSWLSLSHSLFVLRFYNPVSPLGSCGALSVYLTTFSRAGSKWLTSTCAHSLTKLTTALLESAEGRECLEKISWSISSKKCCRTRLGSNPRPPDHQSEAHPTEPPRAGHYHTVQGFRNIMEDGSSSGQKDLIETWYTIHFLPFLLGRQHLSLLVCFPAHHFPS